MASTLDDSFAVYLTEERSAAEVYNLLRQLCEAKTFYTISNKAIKWMT